MAESQSTYSGRKIRIEGQDELETVSSKSNVKPEPGVMTFGEANAKGLLKTGMAVIFKDCVYGPIELEQEMTGKEQQVQCELIKGIVVKRNDEQLAIFTVLRLTSKDGLILKGRYGRANGLETVKNLAKSVEKKIKNCNSSLLSTKEFVDFCQDNPFVVNYFREAVFRLWNAVFTNKRGLLENIHADALQNSGIRINPGYEEHQIHNIGIIIEGRDLECMLKKSKAITINHLHTFQESPHEMHVEIRGIT